MGGYGNALDVEQEKSPLMKAVSRMENIVSNVERKKKMLEIANERKYSFKPMLYKNKYKVTKEQKPDLACYSLGIRPPSPMDRVLEEKPKVTKEQNSNKDIKNESAYSIER